MSDASDLVAPRGLPPPDGPAGSVLGASHRPALPLGLLVALWPLPSEPYPAPQHYGVRLRWGGDRQRRFECRVRVFGVEPATVAESWFAIKDVMGRQDLKAKALATRDRFRRFLAADPLQGVTVRWVGATVPGVPTAPVLHVELVTGHWTGRRARALDLACRQLGAGVKWSWTNKTNTLSYRLVGASTWQPWGDVRGRMLIVPPVVPCGWGESI